MMQTFSVNQLHCTIPKLATSVLAAVAAHEKHWLTAAQQDIHPSIQ
jgi:hypothetical protein